MYEMFIFRGIFMLSISDEVMQRKGDARRRVCTEHFVLPRWLPPPLASATQPRSSNWYFNARCPPHKSIIPVLGDTSPLPLMLSSHYRGPKEFRCTVALTFKKKWLMTDASILSCWIIIIHWFTIVGTPSSFRDEWAVNWWLIIINY